MDLAQQLVALALDKAAVIAILGVILAVCLWLAASDVAWVRSVNEQYAKFKDRNINRISKRETARGFLDDLVAFETERVDATRARSARLVLLGFAIPGLVLLVWLANHTWLFNGECPFQPGPCEPELKSALVFSSWNLIQALPAELLELTGLTQPPMAIAPQNWLLRSLAAFVRYDVIAHIMALFYFEYRVWQFKRSNIEVKRQAEGILNSTDSQNKPAPQPEAPKLQRAA